MMRGQHGSCSRPRIEGAQQVPHVASRWALVDAQVERRRDRQDMVEDIGLDPLVIAPHLVAAEHIDFDRKTVFGRRQMPH